MTQQKKTNYMVKVAVLSVLSFVIMMAEFPIPFMPPWLKIDLSEIPVIFGGFSLGPGAGVAIAFIKSLLHFLLKNNDGTFVGELAGFLCASALILPAAILYRKKGEKKAMVTGLLVGSVSMVIVAALLNYFVLLPIYARILMPMDKLVELAGSVNPAIKSLGGLILVGVVPFNVIKCIILTLVTVLLYDRVKPVLLQSRR